MGDVSSRDPSSDPPEMVPDQPELLKRLSIPVSTFFGFIFLLSHMLSHFHSLSLSHSLLSSHSLLCKVCCHIFPVESLHWLMPSLVVRRPIHLLTHLITVNQKPTSLSIS